MEGGGDAVIPGAFGRGGVISCAGGVRIVGCFVVVPDADERGRGSGRLQAGLAVVLGVALTVILQGETFIIWFEAEAGGIVLGLHEAAFAVFVDAVANVDKSIIITDVGGLGIAVEIFRRDIGAAKDGKSGLAGWAGGQGFCFANGGDDRAARDTETEVVGGIGRESGGDDFHGIILS